jgi:hypothetical protein
MGRASDSKKKFKALLKNPFKRKVVSDRMTGMIWNPQDLVCYIIKPVVHKHPKNRNPIMPPCAGRSKSSPLYLINGSPDSCGLECC